MKNKISKILVLIMVAAMVTSLCSCMGKVSEGQIIDAPISTPNPDVARG